MAVIVEAALVLVEALESVDEEVCELVVADVLEFVLSGNEDELVL